MSETPATTTVTVRIAGEEYTIRAQAEPEYTRTCARFVDERIREIRQRSGLVEGHKAAILAALSVADQYFKARDDLTALRDDVATRADALTRRLEQAAAVDGGSG